MLYFGCWNEPGHYLYDRDGRRHFEPRRGVPFRYTILDAGLLPPDGPATEGVCHRAQIGGWTIISFWDRSIDSRPGSNSSFLCPGDFTFEEMLAAARMFYPQICERFTFELKLAE